MLNRKRARALKLKAIQDRRETYEIQQVLSLLDDLFDEKMQGLIEATCDDFVGKQAEARAYRDLIRMFRDQRPSIDPAQE
jgi:hypothetical protein